MIEVNDMIFTEKEIAELLYVQHLQQELWGLRLSLWARDEKIKRLEEFRSLATALVQEILGKNYVVKEIRNEDGKKENQHPLVIVVEPGDDRHLDTCFDHRYPERVLGKRIA